MKNEGINKRYKVTFVKDGIKYKKGDVAEVSLGVGVQFCERGLVEPTQELVTDAELYGVKLVRRRVKKVEE